MIRAQDRNGAEIRIKAYDWLARVFQHEIDHLDGQLFIDIASKIWEAQSEDSGCCRPKGICWWILILSLPALLSACATPRSPDMTMCDGLGPQLTTPSRAAPADEFNVLLLSAGGPWGAFGVGFLARKSSPSP